MDSLSLSDGLLICFYQWLNDENTNHCIKWLNDKDTKHCIKWLNDMDTNHCINWLMTRTLTTVSNG